jgi:hypothetical protein
MVHNTSHIPFPRTQACGHTLWQGGPGNVTQMADQKKEKSDTVVSPIHRGHKSKAPSRCLKS